MRPSLRTIALLMLLAGLSLGVFTARVLRAVGTPDGRASQAASQDGRVRWYVDLLGRDRQLTADQTQRVSEALRGYDRAVRQKMYDLRVEHQAEFRALSTAAWDRIDRIVAEGKEER